MKRKNKEFILCSFVAALSLPSVLLAVSFGPLSPSPCCLPDLVSTGLLSLSYSFLIEFVLDQSPATREKPDPGETDRQTDRSRVKKQAA
jgi:hypothetical protein